MEIYLFPTEKTIRNSKRVPAGIRRRYDVEIWLKIGRQRGINVILTSFCERWFNINIQTSKQIRYVQCSSIRLEISTFNVEFWLMRLTT